MTPSHCGHSTHHLRRYFDHIDADMTRHAKVALDARLLSFEAGGKLTLVLSNVAMQFVHHYPWVNPIAHGYSVELVLGGAKARKATLAMPMSTGFAERPVYDTSALEQPYWDV